MTNQQQSVEQLFGAALDLPPEERGAFLDHVCKGTPELRLLVDELLLADERAGSFMAGPLIHKGGSSAAADGFSPTRMGDSRSALQAGPPRFEDAQTIADRFVVVRFIARGGMGEVYEVADRFLQGAHVALKVIRPEIAADAGSSHRFEQEVILARKVSHPNLCPIYELFRCEEPSPPFLFLTMKLLGGETLEARLRREALPRHEALQTCTSLISGLAAIHGAGVIHRDIKPNNVMLERCGSRLCVYIMDFGLARLHEAESTIIGAVAGTPGYLAPELLQGYRPTQATDIFALGVVLHHVLTGERPLEARNGRSLLPVPSLDVADAPPLLVRSVKDFLSDDPDQRCRAFDLIQAPAGPYSRPIFVQPQRRPLLDRRRFLLGAGVGACALAGTAIWKREALYDGLHPLPEKRFVALLDWPPPADARIRPMLLGLIDAMGNELARAEAFDHNFFVTVQPVSTAVKTVAELNELRESLGANLVLAASGNTFGKEVSVLLNVLDAASGRTLRSRELRAAVDQQFDLPRRVVRAAAQLLDVSKFEPDDLRSRVGTDYPDALAAFQAAEVYMKEPNDTGLDQAIAKYRAAVDIDRHYALAFAALAIAYLRLYKTRLDASSVTLARANAETAISLDPKLPDAHVALGSVFEDTGALREALHELGLALSLDPGDTRTMTYQAQIYQKMNRLKNAEDTFKRVLRLRPNDWLAYNELAGLYSDQGNYVDALAAYRAAAAAAPNRALTFNNVAFSLFQLGSFDEALTAIDRSIALAPLDGAYQTRADILRAQGRYSEALDAALKGAKLNPEEGANWLEVGDAYSLFPKRAKEAQSAYRRAAESEAKVLAVDPSDGPGTMLLALYRVKSGEPDGALGLIRKAESLGAPDVYSQLAKVRILDLLGKREDALAVLAASMRKGATIYQVQATHDLDSLRADPRYSAITVADVVLPETKKQQQEGRP